MQSSGLWGRPCLEDQKLHGYNGDTGLLFTPGISLDKMIGNPRTAHGGLLSVGASIAATDNSLCFYKWEEPPHLPPTATPTPPPPPYTT